jgi:hypothetical protein
MSKKSRLILSVKLLIVHFSLVLLSQAGLTAFDLSHTDTLSAFYKGRLFIVNSTVQPLA